MTIALLLAAALAAGDPGDGPSTPAAARSAAETERHRAERAVECMTEQTRRSEENARDAGKAANEHAALIAEKRRAMDEFARGLYCSKCSRSASEIERAEHVSFQTHLNNVQGVPKPAPPELIQQKAAEYDQKIQSARRELERLNAAWDEIRNRYAACEGDRNNSDAEAARLEQLARRLEAEAKQRAILEQWRKAAEARERERRAREELRRRELQRLAELRQAMLDRLAEQQQAFADGLARLLADTERAQHDFLEREPLAREDADRDGPTTTPDGAAPDRGLPDADALRTSDLLSSLTPPAAPSSIFPPADESVPPAEAGPDPATVFARARDALAERLDALRLGPGRDDGDDRARAADEGEPGEGGSRVRDLVAGFRDRLDALRTTVQTARQFYDDYVSPGWCETFVTQPWNRDYSRYDQVDRRFLAFSCVVKEAHDPISLGRALYDYNMGNLETLGQLLDDARRSE